MSDHVGKKWDVECEYHNLRKRSDVVWETCMVSVGNLERETHFFMTLYFGLCSQNQCTVHGNCITNAMIIDIVQSRVIKQSKNCWTNNSRYTWNMTNVMQFYSKLSLWLIKTWSNICMCIHPYFNWHCTNFYLGKRVLNLPWGLNQRNSAVL